MRLNCSTAEHHQNRNHVRVRSLWGCFFVPRIFLIPTDFLFRFTRLQYPGVRMLYAMTIDKESVKRLTPRAVPKTFRYDMHRCCFAFLCVLQLKNLRNDGPCKPSLKLLTAFELKAFENKVTINY
ncbi:hypothetical protein EVAR_74425_1 [Eumeta japonica]|uniref:Uncharacterized protein n=1 Tax=Eumeta variegata TaxID=151549 RepID=A0A4C1SDA5_EUMVA|nr:hypothetical protein EVAR_74425_1 [Eumeta japonica]